MDGKGGGTGKGEWGMDAERSPFPLPSSPFPLPSYFPSLESFALHMAKLEKLIPWIAGTILSYVGWFLGAKSSTMLAFILSMVGLGVGIYFGKKWVSDNL